MRRITVCWPRPGFVWAADRVGERWTASPNPLPPLAPKPRGRTPAVMALMPAYGMGKGQPMQEAIHLAVGGGPEDDVTVRRHESIAQDAGRTAFQSVVEDAQEGGVVGGFGNNLRRPAARFKA